MAAYDHENNRLYVNERLTEKSFIHQYLDSSYFVAETPEDTLKHEMFHKKQWDFIKTKGKNYAKIKHEIETDLHHYVAEQQHNDVLYILNNVSENAETSFYQKDSLNELIAEVLLQEEKGIVKDKLLLKLVRRCVS